MVTYVFGVRFVVYVKGIGETSMRLDRRLLLLLYLLLLLLRLIKNLNETGKTYANGTAKLQ